MQENKKLRQKLRSSKNKHTRVKSRPDMLKLTATEVIKKIKDVLTFNAFKAYRAGRNRDRYRRSPWLIEQLKHKAELKRERILQRNQNVECFKHCNYNGV